jgi:hypothetical protein
MPLQNSVRTHKSCGYDAVMKFTFFMYHISFQLWGLRFSQRYCKGFRSSWIGRRVAGLVSPMFKRKVVPWRIFYPSMKQTWRHLRSFEMSGENSATRCHTLEEPNSLYLGCLQITYSTVEIRGTQWHSSLRHCTTNRKVTGPIPDGVIGNFHGHNLSGRTMVLGLIQPLTQKSTRNIFRGG